LDGEGLLVLLFLGEHLENAVAEAALEPVFDGLWNVFSANCYFA
jgi:hypothetical protein